jgi:hypothetical protein
MDTKTILYELGFLDKNGNPARDKDKRWKVGLNQAELIIKTAMKNNNDYDEDVADCEKAVKQAEQEVKDAQEWLMKQKVYLAEAIIKLNNERTNHNNV